MGHLPGQVVMQVDCSSDLQTWAGALPSSVVTVTAPVLAQGVPEPSIPGLTALFIQWLLPWDSKGTWTRAASLLRLCVLIQGDPRQQKHPACV